MQPLKNLYEDIEDLEDHQRDHRSKMITLVKNKLFGFLDEKELNTVIDYLNYSEKLNTSYSKLVLSLENSINTLNHSQIEKIAEKAIKSDKDISKELNETYQDTTVKNYIDGIIRSLKPD
jgi:hypothetical protein